MQKISDITDSNNLILFCNTLNSHNLILFSNTLNSHSSATGFNVDQLCNRFECSKTLYSRVNKICKIKNNMKWVQPQIAPGLNQH